MSAKVIPQAFPVPLLSEDVVRMVQADLQTECSNWLDIIYPIAYTGEEIVKDRLVAKEKTTDPVFRDRVRKFPKVYPNDGRKDYIDVSPSDKYKGSVFFEVPNDFRLDRINDSMDIEVSLIFHVNMPKIDSERAYDFRTELASDAARCLNEGALSAYICLLYTSPSPRD